LALAQSKRMKHSRQPLRLLGLSALRYAPTAGRPALLRTAARLATDLSLPFVEKPVTKGYEMLLVATPDRLELRVLVG